MKRDESSLIGLKTQKLEDSLSSFRTQREEEEEEEFLDNKENEIFQFWKEFRRFLQGSLTEAMLISSKHTDTFKLIDVVKGEEEKERKKRFRLLLSRSSLD